MAMAECDTRDASAPDEAAAWAAVDDAVDRLLASPWHIGRALIDAKAATPHGEWLSRLAVRGIETRAAQRMMHVARELTEAQAVEAQSLRGMLAVAAGPDPDGDADAATGSEQTAAARPISWTDPDDADPDDDGETDHGRQHSGRSAASAARDPWPADIDDDAETDEAPGALRPDGSGVASAGGGLLSLPADDALAAIPEAELQRTIVEAAGWGGWKIMHIRDSRGQTANGWPDLTLVRAGRMLALELKSARGVLRPGQAEWLEALGEVPGIEARVVRPADLTALVAELTDRP